MPIYAQENNNQFTKVDTGKYFGTVIDVVDLGLCVPKNTTFSSAPVHRVQIVWVLNTNGPDGKPLIHSEAPPNKLVPGGKYKPSRLYTITSGVLGVPPSQPFSLFDIESLLGKSNELFIMKTGDGNDARSEIAGFVPLPPGVTPPAVPAGFVRKINQPQRSQSAQPVQSAQSVQQPQPAQPFQPAQQAQERAF